MLDFNANYRFNPSNLFHQNLLIRFTNKLEFIGIIKCFLESLNSF